jgi:hypothetical protein
MLCIVVLPGGCQPSEVRGPAADPGSDWDRVNFSHALWDSVLKAHVDTKGRVNYRALKSNRSEFDTYLVRLGLVAPDALASDRDRYAFWINAYNALTVQAVLNLLNVDDDAAVNAWRTNASIGWKDYAYTCGGRSITLDAIEHEILRPTYKDPRVHAAIVCASVGCPALAQQAYTAEALDAMLDAAMRNFLADASKNRWDPAKRTLTLSPIFRWFTKDFTAQERSIIGYARKWLPGDPTIPDDAAVVYSDYSWQLNILR